MRKRLGLRSSKAYEIAMQQVYNESQVVWQYSGAYILANTVIIGFISQNIDKNNPNIILFMGILGFLINIIWLGSSERRWGWYEFRMAQAREMERMLNYDLVSKRGLDFSKGKKVKVDKKPMRLNFLARMFSTLISTRLLILLFTLFYALIIAQKELLDIWRDLFSNMDSSFFVFLIIGIIFGIFYSWQAINLGWNGDYGFKHIIDKVGHFKNQHGEEESKRVPVMVDRRDIFDEDPPPISWQIERVIQSFLGAVLGWLVLWFLLAKRLDVFNEFKNMKLDWWDGVLLIIGYIGINGRLPTIAHSVQEWLRR